MQSDFFEYHKALVDAVVEGPEVDYDRLIWVMTPEFRFALFQYSRHLGVEKDDGDYLGIPIISGVPTEGQPFELRVRDVH